MNQVSTSIPCDDIRGLAPHGCNSPRRVQTMCGQLLPLLVFMLFSYVGFAQGNYTITGKVVSRVDRVGIEGAKVSLQPNNEETTTSADGVFTFTTLLQGDYVLMVESKEYQPTEVNVRIDKKEVYDLGIVGLSPALVGADIINDDFADQGGDDGESDQQNAPVMLSASADVFERIAGSQFAERRFRPRGYESNTSDVYFNGIYMNDVLTGSSPWGLVAGLNDVTMGQERVSGIRASDYGVGGINGTTNINLSAANIRKGFRSTLAASNRQYRLRAAATYASGENSKGWAYAFAVSTRQGDNDWVRGVYYDAWGYYGSVEKRINEQHRMSLTVLGAPTVNGTQGGATQEIYDILGDNYYNPNWGYQNGKVRNARERSNHEPVAILNHTYTPNRSFSLYSAVSYRLGYNGYSAVEWYNAEDPRPDYYRNLPSYFEEFTVTKDEAKAAYAREGWLTNENIRHVNWQQFYDVNRTSYFDPYLLPNVPSVDNTTLRSKYIVEERMVNQQDLNAKMQANWTIANNSKLSGGVDIRWNRTENFKRIKDLLGGDTWLDIDQFAERDFPTGDVIQNDLNNPYRTVKVGDKFGYDYYAHTRNLRTWSTYAYNLRNIEGYAGAELGYLEFWREGLYKKGLFPQNSYGASAKQHFLTYTLKTGITYKIAGTHFILANVGYDRQAPYFSDAFMSPRTRNSVVPQLDPTKVFTADLGYTLRTSVIKLRASGYYTQFKDKVKLISLFDDIERSYVNVALRGIDQRHTGVEFGFEAPLYKSVTLRGALNYGLYEYTSDPYYTKTIDNSDEYIGTDDRVYWKGSKVAGTPMTAANIGVLYRSSRNLYVALDANYYDAIYVDMNPLRRTNDVLNRLDEESKKSMVLQERFPNAFVLNASAGKSWFFNQRKYQFGVNLDAKNILNRQDVKMTGYEQVRIYQLTDESASTGSRTIPFDSRYQYMMGMTYNITAYLRF